MSFLIEHMMNNHDAAPCLFYPAARKKGVTISQLLSDNQVQADVLIDISCNYNVSAVIRMTELWCEAASFGMECNISENDFPRLGQPLAEDIVELVEVKLPHIENKITAPLIDAVQLVAPRMDKPLIVGATGPYTLCSVLNGSGNFMMNCMINSEDSHILLSRITDFLIDYISAYKDAGAAGLILAEPSASMISPAMMEEFSNIYIKKIIDVVQDGTFSIIYHNCGAVNKHMDIISQLDTDAFHFGSEVDLELALNTLDKTKLVMGNIDPQMFIWAKQSDIESTAKRLLDSYNEANNWRISTGCDLSPSASIDKVEYFLKYVNDYRR